MNNTYIKSLAVNLFNGIFNTTINFNNGLNIISGINGTGKTQVLQLLQNNQGITSDPSKNSNQLSIFAVSPKRNTEKQAVDSIFQQIRTQNKTIETFINQIKGFQIKDSGFENYPSFVELFIQEYELLMQDGITGHADAVLKTVTDFNGVLNQVFPEYEIQGTWVAGTNGLSGKLDLKIKKYGTSPIPIETLSTGEREVFALLFCIFVSRNKEDVYLIDEPEIHLNWDLEKGLFNFLDWFCNAYNKQIIVVSHSRIIFKKEFYPKTQFLIWESGKIVCKSEIAEQQKVSIAGEISDTVSIIQFTKQTIFVEDPTHKLFLDEVALSLGKSVEVVICGSKSNVKSLYLLMKDSGQNNIYFIVDGDNEGCNISDQRFISLKKYCIENYIFDPSILAKISTKTEDEVKQLIVDSIKEINQDKHSLVYKKLAEVANSFPFEVIDTYSGKDLLRIFSSKLSRTSDQLIKDFILTAKSDDKVNTVFSEIIPALPI